MRLAPHYPCGAGGSRSARTLVNPAEAHGRSQGVDTLSRGLRRSSYGENKPGLFRGAVRTPAEHIARFLDLGRVPHLLIPTRPRRSHGSQFSDAAVNVQSHPCLCPGLTADFSCFQLRHNGILDNGQRHIGIPRATATHVMGRPFHDLFVPCVIGTVVSTRHSKATSASQRGRWKTLLA
ncbi:hypothetical protein BV20DRAFT_967282 [Pilatotrama ljubarskyi]|nr:hypothetical protein BV20DRAFT_967282 [Pilatotrama ljubarskyi]